MPSFDAIYSAVSTTTSRSRKMNSVYSINCDIEKVTIPGIGVAIQLPSGDIKIDYKDGSSLTVKAYLLKKNVLTRLFRPFFLIMFLKYDYR